MMHVRKTEAMGQFAANICRLCAGISAQIPIHDNISNKIDLKIKKCLPCIAIHENDEKPKQVCITCISKLDICNELVELCLAAESRFESMLQFPQKQESMPVKNTLLHEQQVDCSPDGNCVWPDQVIKNNIQTVALEQRDYEDSVIVLSKMDNLSSSQQEGVAGQDYVVMVELKYKDNIQLAADRHITITTDVQSNHQPLEARKIVSAPSYHTRSNGMVDKELNPIVSYSAGLGEFAANVTSFECLGSQPSDKDHTTIKVLQKDSTYSGISCSKEQRDITKNKPLASDGKVLFECTLCSKKFSRRTRLKSHSALHSEIRPYPCTQCDKAFITRWDRTCHLRIHSGTFSCEYCGKAFSVANKLERHIRTHTGERPFSCKQCGKAFSDKNNLVNHERIHSSIRPFRCPVCSKAFKIRSHLVDHQHVHMTETPFKCRFCEKTFKWKTNYNAHIKTHKRDPVIV